MSPEQKRKFVMIGTAGAVLLLAVVLYAARRPRADLEIGPTYTVYGVCLETKKEYEIKANIKDAAPFKNPDTGRTTVYPWWFCSECKYRFVPSPQAAPPHRQPMTAGCPHCKSSMTSSWGKGMPDTDNPAGDAPLPAIPG